MVKPYLTGPNGAFLPSNFASANRPVVSALGRLSRFERTSAKLRPATYTVLGKRDVKRKARAMQRYLKVMALPFGYLAGDRTMPRDRALLFEAGREAILKYLVQADLNKAQAVTQGAVS